MKTPVLLSVGLGALLVAACGLLESDVARPSGDMFALIDQSPLVRDAGDEDALGGEARPSEQRPPASRIAGDELVSLNFRSTPLAEAIQLIAESAGINVYVDAQLHGIVDASFPSVSLDDALASILSRNGLALEEDPPGIFWVRVADGSEAATASFRLHSIGVAQLKPKLEALVSEGTTVVIEENQNLVLIRGTQADAEIVGRFLESADRLRPQVLVEVHLFEVNLDETFELGVEANAQGTINGNAYTILQSFLTSPTNFQFTLEDSDGDISALVTALREYAALELISSPKVLAITNTEATIEIIEEVPYVNVTSTNDAGGGSSVLEEVQFKEAGIRLKVTPVVQENAVIQIAVDQQLSEVVGFFNEVPIVDSRQVISQFLVGDRQTTVLGGLMQDERMNRDQGIPVLMNIPFLGRLFRGDQDTSEKRELLLFLTARIVDPKEAARLSRIYQDEFRERRDSWSERDVNWTEK